MTFAGLPDATPELIDVRRLAVGVRLTPTQRRLLAYLAEHGAELPWLSATDLAGRVGVSQPSVTRLATVLGFGGWGGLREELRRLAVERPPPPTATDRARQALAEEVDNLDRLAAALPGPDEWAAIGAAARASVPLVVAGLRAGAYLAGYCAYLARKVHPGVVSVTQGGADASDALVEAAASGATMAVVVCVPRYPTETIDLLRRAAGSGYRILLVSDEAMPPVPGVEPEWHVAVPVGSGLTFDAHPAALLTLALLVEAVCDAEPTVTEQRLEALDDAAAGAGTYWER